MTKQCSRCEVVKPLDGFKRHSGHVGGRYSICRQCTSEQGKTEYSNAKELVLTHYGAKCALCSETNEELLQIDHIYNNGHQHRLDDSRARVMALWLVKHGFPTGYQTLCRRCNLMKHSLVNLKVDSDEWRQAVKAFAYLLGGVKPVLNELIKLQ